MEGTIKDSVFLALDNMFGMDASINEARSYLSAKLPLGSIVMVTSRSKTALMKLRSYIDKSNCLEMLELMLEEAKCLFMRSIGSVLGDNVDHEQLIDPCVKQCYFKKVESNFIYHYHPLALDVLGRHLGCIDPKQWGANLDKLGEGTSKERMELDHHIFSILRSSFDSLMPDDKMLFMDIALFKPRSFYSEEVLDWLRIVHIASSVTDVMSYPSVKHMLDIAVLEINCHIRSKILDLQPWNTEIYGPVKVFGSRSFLWYGWSLHLDNSEVLAWIYSSWRGWSQDRWWRGWAKE